jgi:Protein of unknown function (DUF2911)
MRRPRSLAPLALVALAAAAPALAQSGPPRPSPKATVSQVAGLTEITISYSSPAVKGRPIWGALVPYDQVWRTGANEATTFKTTTDVTVEGKPLAAGTYAFFTIPHKDRWTIVFNSQAEQWGAFNHDKSKDVLSVDVTPTAAPPSERLAFGFSDFTDNGTTVVLRWEKVAVPFKVTFDTPKLAIAQADKELAAADVKPGALISWSRWLQQNDLVPDKALVWVQRATATETGAKSYWAKAVEARLLAKAGKKAEARAAAAAAVPLAPTAPDAENAKADAVKLEQEAATWK